MQDDHFPAPLLRVLEGFREQQLLQTILGPDVLGPPDVPTLVLVGEATVQDGEPINLLLELSLQEITHLQIPQAGVNMVGSSYNFTKGWNCTSQSKYSRTSLYWTNRD